MSDRIVFEKNGKTITLAEHSGFCYGVKTALQKTLKTVEEYEGTGRRVYTFGPIIHNDDVVNDLNMRGVQICSAPGSTEKDAAVIIRSHGVPASVEAALRDSCGQLIDATCPHVKKIHRLADDAYHEGRTIVVIGDAGHPEVQGIDGWCGNEAVIFSDPAEIERPKNLARLNRAEEILAVAQTTLNRNVWDACTEALLRRYPRAQLRCTICSATSSRQTACRRVAEISDAMVVIGGRSSSNSRKLYEIASEVCENTYFIENTSHLPLKDIAKYNKIGVSAGASAPERIIKEVISNMSDIITNNIDESNEMNDFMAEIEKSLKMPQRGEIVKGEVIQVGPREVYVNLGCKKTVSFQKTKSLSKLIRTSNLCLN